MERTPARSREIRERIRRRLGLNYVVDERARGKCWVCHYNPAEYSPENAQEYAIWRKRGLKICCSRRRCIDRAFAPVDLCDYFKSCRGASWFHPGDEYKRELLRRRDIVRCDECEKFSFDDPLEDETLCTLCGRDAELYDVTSHFEKPIYDVCYPCYKKINHEYAMKYFTFSDDEGDK